MDPTLAQRLADIERRLTALEHGGATAVVHLPPPEPRRAVRVEPTAPVVGADQPPEARAPGARPPQGARPVPPPPPLPPKPILPDRKPAAVAAHPEPAVDWERFFGLAVLGRIGVAAVLLAAGYFAQLAYRDLPPIGRVLSIYGLSALFIGVGAWLRPRVSPRYLALLWGGGAASAYLAAIAAHLRYDLVGDTVALGLLVLASALGHGLARILRHQTLASMALAGAFAAPLIADASLANGPFLMSYLLLLHGSAAWVEDRWRWRSARVVALAGTGVVVARWLMTHGAVDVPTFLLLHGYLLGLVAPELLRVARRRGLSRFRATLVPAALAVAEGTLLLAPLLRWQSVRDVCTLPLLSGIVWTGLAVLLASRVRARADHALVRGLARLGGVLAAVGVAVATIALPADSMLESETLIVWGASLVALGALGLRRIVGTGDFAAAVAVPIACLAGIAPRAPEHVLSIFPVAAAAAAAVVLLARHGAARGVAAWSGLLAVGVGLASGARLSGGDALWVALGLVAAAGWARGMLTLGRLRADRTLRIHGALQLWVVAWHWVVLGFTSLRVVDLPLADPITLAGVAVAALAAHAAWTRTANDDHGRFAWLGGASLWALALALPVLAGHREMVSAVAELGRAARDAWHVIYFAGAGVVVAGLAGYARRDAGRVGILGALAVVAVAVVKTLADAGRMMEATPWASAQVAAALLGPWLVVRLARRRSDGGFVGFVLFATAAFAYLVHAGLGHVPADVPFLGQRGLLGFLAIGLLWTFPYRVVLPSVRQGVENTALLGGLLFGFVVGYAELADLVRPLPEAWPDVLASVYMALFAAGTLAAGFLRQDKRLRYPALGLFGLVVLKVGLHDLATAATALRIFVTGILGLVLLGAAFAYARRTDGAETKTHPDPASGA